MRNQRLAGCIVANASLWCLLIVAFALRVSCITWGVPLNEYSGYYHPDEAKIVRGAMDFPADILHRQDLRYPTFYHYAIGTLTLPVRLGIRFLGPSIAEEELYLIHYLIARFCSLLLGTLTVAVIYRLAKHIYDEQVAVLAAGFLTVSKLHVTHSSWATVDVATSFLAVCALYGCYTLIDRPTLRNYGLLALAGGALMGTKYPGAVIVLPAVVAHVAAQWPRRDEAVSLSGSIARVIRHPGLLVLLGGTLIVFLLTTPTLALRPHRLIEAVEFETTRLARRGGSRLDPAMWWQLWRKLGQQVLGMPLASAAVLGLGRILIRPLSREALPLAFALPYCLILASRTTGRYTLILVPFLCLFAATLLGQICFSPARAMRYLGMTITFFVVVASLLFSLAGIYTRLSPDPRTLAAKYITDNIAPGRSIGVGDAGNYRCEPWMLPRISRDRYVLTNCLHQPDYIVLTSSCYEMIEEALASPHLRDYVWDEAQASFWFPGEPPSSDVFRLYDDLLHGTTKWYDYELVTMFQSHGLVYISFAPPEIRIYRHRQFEPRFFSLPTDVQQRVKMNLEDKVSLVGYNVPQTVEPGGSLTVTLYWQAYQPMDISYTVFVHLLDKAGQMWGQRDSIPKGGTRPTTNWFAGEVIPDVHDIPIDSGISPGAYGLEVGMYDAISGERLLIYGEEHQPIDDRLLLKPPIIIRWPASYIVPSTIQHQRCVDLGDGVRLLGYALASANVQPGQVISLTLYWQAREEMRTSYTVFTHLLDVDEKIVAQRDQIPGAGKYPTTGWKPGEVIADRYLILVPKELPAGLYHLTGGMYEVETGERLPAFGADGQRLPEERILLGQIEVRRE